MKTNRLIMIASTLAIFAFPVLGSNIQSPAIPESTCIDLEYYYDLEDQGQIHNVGENVIADNYGQRFHAVFTIYSVCIERIKYTS